AEAENALIRVNEKLSTDSDDQIVRHRLVFLNSDTAGQMVVELDKSEGREIDGFEIAKLWREEMPEIPGIKSFKVNASTGGGGAGADISLQLRGTNLTNLKLATDELKSRLAE